MAVKLKHVTLFTCERCGHEWQGRKEIRGTKLKGIPKICPKCKSSLWNVPKTR